MLSALSTILATWLLATVALIGIGLLAVRLGGRAAYRAEHVVLLFWVGWCGTIAFLQVWHLFLPVNLAATLFIGLLGAAGLVANWQSLLSLMAVRKPFLSGLCLAVLLPLSVWLANRSLGEPMNPDSGLYHLSAVRWTATYPIVPGLVNLHRVLAYNNSYFLYVSLFDIGAFWGKSHHLANGILLFWAFAPIVYRVLALFLDRDASASLGIFACVLLYPLVEQSVGYNVTSPSPDFGVVVLQIITTYWAAQFAFCRDEVLSHAPLYVVGLAFTAVVGITVKLSFLGFATGVAFVLLSIGIMNPSRSHDTQRRLIAYTVLAALFALGTWMVRGVILSGYPVYPIPVARIPVEWAAPVAEARDQFNMLRAWGRVPNVHWSRVFGNWEWFGPWLREFSSRPTQTILPLGLTSLAVLATLLQYTFVRDARKRDWVRWACLLPPGIGAAYWLLTAPDIRWSGVCFWLLAATTLAVALAGMSRASSLLCGAAFSLSPAAVLAMHLVAHPLWLPLDGDDWFPPVRMVVVRPFVTNSGLVLYVPQYGFRCWGAPLPCTPDPDRRLRLRRAGALGSGFVVDRPKKES